MLSARTGLHPEDQKLVYKDKERDSKAFLDMAGVKDRSKMVLLEDPAAQAKRLLEQRRTDKADPAGDGVPRRIRSVAARGGRIRRARTVRRGGLPPPRRDLHHGHDAGIHHGHDAGTSTTAGEDASARWPPSTTARRDPRGGIGVVPCERLARW